MNSKKFLLAALLFFPALVIAKDFKGAELRTKASYTYGRFEVRLKSTAREGVLASFFTYHDGDVAANWNELDIEILGRYDREVQFNAITPGQTHHVRHHPVAFNPHLDFHVYAIEWTPSYVAWFIDEVEVYRQTDAHVAT
ncbi:family 16 glycosylhydrolase, partial [candidate division KSB1 bacterium]|nr:family 16 glycosylhydrolase [candidate division KSB1 bacterium]